MPNQQLLIHIGYPKTASTWLRNVIFKEEAGFMTPWGYRVHQVMKEFVYVNPFRFEAESARRVFELGLYQAAEKQLVPVISHEILASDQVSGRFWGKEVADRLYATFPEARILVCIREQKSMIISSYREYIKNGGTEKIEKFINSNPSKYKVICRLDHLEFDGLIRYYQSLFGANNILALPYEMLKKDHSSFCKKILEFSGANDQVDLQTSSSKANEGYKAGRVTIQRYLNSFVQPSSKPPLKWIMACKASAEIGKIIPPEIHKRLEKYWQNYVAEQVGDYFRNSNQQTSQLIGKNLADFGYNC